MKCLPLITMIVLLISCGNKKSDTKKTVRLSEEDIAGLLANQRFSCAAVDGSPCPDGIARVFILNPIEPEFSSLCTGFLTSSNKLVTNNHCLATQDQCQNTYVAIYRQGQYETARCLSIIKTLDDGEALVSKTLDVTVMELDQHIAATPLVLASGGPAEGSRVSAWVVDHLDLLQGRITELACRSIGTDGSQGYAECPAISGNSGSPMINANGRVVGVLWGSTLDNSFNSDLELETRRSLPALSFATGVRYFRSYSLP